MTGGRARKDRGRAVPRAPLTRERVVAAALRILDRDGLEGLTMRALGRELGVDPMAVYYHVPNKAALLDGVVEAVWSELELPEWGGGPWQVQLERIARAMRETLRAHPNALPVMATRPNLSAPGFRLVDRTLEVLLAVGLPPQEAMEFVNAAGSFLFGLVLTEVGQPLGGAEEVADAEILRAVDRARDAEAFPSLSDALRAVDLARLTPDRFFEAGVQVLRRGLERRLEELAAEGGG